MLALPVVITVINHIQTIGCCCGIAAIGRSACWPVIERVKESGNNQSVFSEGSDWSGDVSLHSFVQNVEFMCHICFFLFVFSLCVLSMTREKSVIVVGELCIISSALAGYRLLNIASLQLLLLLLKASYSISVLNFVVSLVRLLVNALVLPCPV